MATRERYARTWVEYEGLELTIGLELRDDDVRDLTETLRLLAVSALRAWHLAEDFHTQLIRVVEGYMDDYHNGRAFFIETEHNGKGVQVFQPWGLPRAEAEPCAGPCQVPGCPNFTGAE